MIPPNPEHIAKATDDQMTFKFNFGALLSLPGKLDGNAAARADLANERFGE